MSTLNGALDSIGLAPLIGFLGGLGKSGRLVVTDGPWSGWVTLYEGHVTGAGFGVERGLAALDALVLALGQGEFTFIDAEEGPPQTELNLTLTPQDVQARCQEVAREAAVIARVIPSFLAQPRLSETEWIDDEEVTLTCSLLRLLLMLDEPHTVAELAEERGVTRTLRELRELARLGLITIEPVFGARTLQLALPAPAESDGGSLQPSRTLWRRISGR